VTNLSELILITHREGVNVTPHTGGVTPSRATAESPHGSTSTVLQRFAGEATERHRAPDGNYAALWQWSVDHEPRFWRAVREFFEVQARDGTAPSPGDAGVLINTKMPKAQWFPGVKLNYVDQVLRHADRPGPAIIGVDESGDRTEIAWRDLPSQVGAVANELRRRGVGRGDTVAPYLPDIPQATVAFLATAVLGAIAPARNSKSR
jgi:acetoacetyl-CoA synthetase